MQVDKPLTPHKIRNLNPGRKTPPKIHPNTRVEDKHRIMDMHEILHGNRVGKPVQVQSNMHNRSIRQLSPQRVEPQIVQVHQTKQTKKVQIQGNPPVSPKVFLNIERRVEEGVMVYCPVCERNYPNTRIKEHVQRHLQPDPIFIKPGPVVGPVVTEIVTTQQQIPHAQKLMIVEPVECVMNNDVFGGNTFYVIDNAQAVPKPVIEPFIPPHQSLLQQQITQQYVQPVIISQPSVHFSNMSNRQTNTIPQIIAENLDQQFNSMSNPSYASNPLNHPLSQGPISYTQNPIHPLQIIQQQHSIQSPHSSFRQITSVPMINSVVQPQIQQSYINQSNLLPQNTFVEMNGVPTYPVYYPMKKATKFNLFSCFDDIGHDSFHAESMIHRNDFYARARQ